MASLPLRWQVHAVASTAIIPPVLRCFSFERVAAWLARAPISGGRPLAQPDDTALAEWVDRLLRKAPRPWRYTCLTRSAVLYHLLRRARRPVELWLGVRRDQRGHLAAHAWLVRDGCPYLEPHVDHPARFAVISRFPQP